MHMLANNKTKLVCTIGPASDSPRMLEKMLEAGMNVARLNFSHGDFASHGEIIQRIRTASEKTGKRVAILADLPGPKMRILDLAEEFVTLEKDASFILTAEEVIGTAERVAMTMKELPAVVRKGDTLFLNDGLIELRVQKVQGEDIHCTVIVGGKLWPRKGLNIPGIDLGTSAFTAHDRECMQFALEHGVDAIGQSFVNTAQDVLDVRKAAAEMGFDPFIVSKIERASVWENIDGILEVTDGVMVARGDLGVEIPIEEIAVAQKTITARANLFGIPVITATQMLESMTGNRRPTRAESTDVANAILDGTDCVMLSEESAMGDYPLEAVQMLAKIARVTEPHRLLHNHFEFTLKPQATGYTASTVDMIAISIENIFSRIDSLAAVLAPTHSGHMARALTRFRLPVWILAVSTSVKTCRDLMFSYGVHPILEKKRPENWTNTARNYIKTFGLEGNCMVKAEGPSPDHPDINHKMEIIEL
ncbi:pyruvate kinase [Desulfocapsa sulfexigens DSM 10523]|uniref:Pyruvate kinase n=1 Tax=Desulfocapsa sulfexigens (strain DSM 10523 / SB164P1) TaxID=1167006 RepID=M1P067_DESSD|nr:pyruvate kinase [Desulfocapsa sulfexigens DSM 10523]